MPNPIPQGSGDLIALPITKDGVAATNTTVTSVNVAAYAHGSTPAYTITASYADGQWCFSAAALAVGAWEIRAQVNAPGESGILLDFGTLTVVP